MGMGKWSNETTRRSIDMNGDVDTGLGLILIQDGRNLGYWLIVTLQIVSSGVKSLHSVLVRYMCFLR